MSRVSTTLPAGPVKNLVRGLTRRIPGTRSQRVGRAARASGWRVYLLHTKSGQVGPMIDPIGGDWSIKLNGIEEMSVTLAKADLAGIDRAWYTPWWGGLLFTWHNGETETPILAGPITQWSTETRRALGLEAKGLRGLYEHLVIGTDLKPRNVSLGQIMWELASVPGIKPGGGLPIVDGSPDPDGRGHVRNYYSWNLANVGLDKLMTELSNVINGPDVMFRPRYRANDPRFIEWAVEHGTHLSPRIESGGVHDFDTTAARSAVEEISIGTDSSALVSRVWCTGTGEGPGTRIARAEDLSLVKAGFPFLEEVISDPGATSGDDTASSEHPPEAEELAKLSGLAQGELAARVDAVDQITVKVPVDHPTRGVDRLRVGDAAHVTVSGWVAVPDGTLRTRIVKASGDLGGMMTVDFQEDTWI